AELSVEVNAKLNAKLSGEDHAAADPKKARKPLPEIASNGPAIANPPTGFGFVLACAARPGRAEEVLGDAEHEFHQMARRFGVPLARWWYRIFVVKTAARMLPNGLMRLVWSLSRGA